MSNQYVYFYPNILRVFYYCIGTQRHLSYFIIHKLEYFDVNLTCNSSGDVEKFLKKIHLMKAYICVQW